MPPLTDFCRLNELGLVAVGQRLEPRRAASWNPANDAVLAEGKQLLIKNPGRFAVVTTIEGVRLASTLRGGSPET